MLSLFKTYVIGGRSGKREQAWAVFILWCVAFGWFMRSEAASGEMPGTQSILSGAFWPVMINLAAAHGMEWVSSQSLWRNNQ